MEKQLWQGGIRLCIWRVGEASPRASSLGKAVLCWPKYLSKDLWGINCCLDKGDFHQPGWKLAEGPGKRPACLSALEPSFQSRHSSIRELLLSCRQLTVSCPLTQPSLHRTNYTKGTPRLNPGSVPSSPLAWNKNMTNLSLLWNVLFLHLAYEETFSCTLLAHDVIIIPAVKSCSTIGKVSLRLWAWFCSLPKHFFCDLPIHIVFLFSWVIPPFFSTNL